MPYSFGEKLKSLRLHRGLSQEDLAEKLNSAYGTSINKGMISKWENDREEPRMEAVRNIAHYFNQTLDELLGIPNEVEHPYHALSEKDERDIAKDLERMLADLEGNEALAFNGEPMDEETKRLFAISLENSLRLAKEMAKQKFTPKKYRN